LLNNGFGNYRPLIDKKRGESDRRILFSRDIPINVVKRGIPIKEGRDTQLRETQSPTGREKERRGQRWRTEERGKRKEEREESVRSFVKR
jgi:hypothetical protein